MAVRGTLVGLTAPALEEIRDACQAAIVAGTVRGISYSIAGRSFTFPSLSEAGNMLQEAVFALNRLNGSTSQNVRANFNPALGRNAR
jgi:hypothetical protein